MTKKSYTIFPLAPFHLAGLATLQFAVIMAGKDPGVAALLLAAFAALCIGAAFVQRLRFYLPIIRHGTRNSQIVAITFDDGPNPVSTPALLNLLASYSAKATFFITGEDAKEYPELVYEILRQGHEIGNNSHRRDVFLMLKSPTVLTKEIDDCQKALMSLGVKPLAFRPPAGITSPYLFRVLINLGLYCVGFSCHGGYFRNRLAIGLTKYIQLRIRTGDILLLHDRRANSGEAVEKLLRQVENILMELKERGLRPALLSEVIRRPVMEPIDAQRVPNLVKGFYDGLAEEYDAEQDQTSQSIVRRTEYSLVMDRLPRLLSKSDNILELGAGTGRFTLPIAKLARRVLAVDISARMLGILGGKATKIGVHNVEVLHGDIAEISIDATFDLICAFSCLEYTADLHSLFRRLHPCLKPDGILYFTIAHRSVLRLFAQIGNAMRQGLWLHARSRREITHLLNSCGFTPVHISTHGLKSVISSGVLMEVIAHRSDHSKDRTWMTRLSNGITNT